MSATPTSAASGSQTATINIEHVLGGSAITGAGIYQLVVNPVNLTAGDKLELRIYSKARSGDSETLEWSCAFDGNLPPMLLRSLAIPTDCYFKATLKQTAGTGRAFSWNILAL